MVMSIKPNALVVPTIVCGALLLLGCGGGGGGVFASFCPNCKGEGNRTCCSDCWGEGLRVDEEKISYNHCSTCFGSGQNPGGNQPFYNETLAQLTMHCPSCGGRGRKRIVTPVRVHCERCDGTGEGSTKMICARCNGSGRWRGIFRSGKNLKGWVPAPSQFILPKNP